jgi:hypothetical protein
MSGHPEHKVKNNCDIVSVTALEQLFTGSSYKKFQNFNAIRGNAILM